MSLFKLNKEVQELFEIDNNLITPFGTISLNINIDNHNVVNRIKGKSFFITDKSKLTKWENEHYEVELLINEPNTKMIEHMKVEKCIAVIWRFRFKSNPSKVLIQTKFSNDDVIYDSIEVDSGEHLYAIGIENIDYKLHIGTQDEEVLVHRKEVKDYFPIKLLNENHYYNPFVDTNKGIAMLLENIVEGEICQVHFVVSWAKYKKWDVSTWLAVDKNAKELLPDCVEY